MKSIKYLFILLVFSSLSFSCENDGYADYDPGQVRTKALAGEWWIVGYNNEGEPAFGGDYNLWSTYNTAANNDSIWIDDHGSFFEVKTKAIADLDDLTFFSRENADEIYTNGSVTISNGIIIPNGGRSATGVVTDSIYFEAEFDWDPGVIYLFGGHERTGFLEDEDPHIE